MSLSRIALYVLSGVLLSSCAAPKPVPFDLVDSANATHRGMFDPAKQSMQLQMGSKTYRGFYVVSTSTANSTDFGMGINNYGRYGAYGAYPTSRYTTVSSNTGRAHLQTPEGDHLNCEFLFESRRIVGECKSPQGVAYQLVANQVGK